MTAKTGNTLTAIEINDHLRASEVLDVDSNESNVITMKLTRKGFSMSEVSLASLFLISSGTFQIAIVSVFNQA